ncbi:uncharacterized protein ACR2FA_005130 [Aphomia sociella]
MEEQIKALERTETPDTADTTEDTKPVEGEDQERVGEGAASNVEINSEGLEEAEGEHVEGEHMQGEHMGGKDLEAEKVLEKREQILGEELEGEQVEGEAMEEQENKKEQKVPEEETVEEEEQYVEEDPPPDPTAPFNFSNSKEALREPFELRPEQLAEVEQLWDIYQNYTPAYTNINNYITEKELIYMLKSLLLMTVTPEQLQELIDFCVRPPHPEGHITFEQFLKIVTIRQRDFLIEDELRSALQVFDPERIGSVDRENLKEVLAKQGHKMSQRQLDNLIKEVDMANDGTIGIEDVVGTMCIDLNKEDLLMLMASLNANAVDEVSEDNA